MRDSAVADDDFSRRKGFGVGGDPLDRARGVAKVAALRGAIDARDHAKDAQIENSRRPTRTAVW